MDIIKIIDTIKIIYIIDCLFVNICHAKSVCGNCEVTKISNDELHDYITNFCQNNENTIHGHTKYFKYKDFECMVAFYESHFNGYIKKVPEFINGKKVIDWQWDDQPDEFYEPHGGFTSGNTGFDCAHCTDVVVRIIDDKYYIAKYSRQNDNSFKSDHFVTNELKKLVDSIIYLTLKN
jgi:hypothetical protein